MGWFWDLPFAGKMAVMLLFLGVLALIGAIAGWQIGLSIARSLA